ncbi:MAG: XdhC family protein, partial [Betaproteobacteria bacterium]
MGRRFRGAHAGRQCVAQGRSAVLVELRGVKGSAPRDAGTRMVVTAE